MSKSWLDDPNDSAEEITAALIQQHDRKLLQEIIKRLIIHINGGKKRRDRFENEMNKIAVEVLQARCEALERELAQVKQANANHWWN
jgi:hypothetical protein